MKRIIQITVLIFLFASESNAQDNTLTFKVRRVQYSTMGKSNPVDRPPATKALTIARLLKYIPAKTTNRTITGSMCEIISCRMTLVDLSNKSTVIIIQQTPALNLINRFLDIQEGTSIEIDQIKVIDAVGVSHDLPKVRFSAVDARGVARLELLKKKIMG